MPPVQVIVRRETCPGEVVVLVGSGLLAGCWIPRSSSLKLSTDAHTYPCWSALFDLREGEELEFKFVVLSSRHEQWEEQIANRLLVVPRGGIQLAAAFGFSELSVGLPSPTCWQGLPLLLAESRIHFSVKCHTRMGERVVLVGSSLATSEWTPSASLVELRTDRFSYPLWTGSVVLPWHLDLEYKFVIIDSERATRSWEAGKNRQLTMQAGGQELELRATFNQAGERLLWSQPPVAEQSIRVAAKDPVATEAALAQPDMDDTVSEILFHSAEADTTSTSSFAESFSFNPTEEAAFQSDSEEAAFQAAFQSPLRALLVKVKELAPDQPAGLDDVMSRYKAQLSPEKKSQSNNNTNTPENLPFCRKPYNSNNKRSARILAFDGAGSPLTEAVDEPDKSVIKVKVAKQDVTTGWGCFPKRFDFQKHRHQS
ncbi:unnamed protein product [Polarella glacialis]|uniref:CBM20 domain-containing protein n=1 Tax=Polarella glacialis TaxID=89957 RepID=A0A813JAG9_POLGL|nr:unnamed protein product [Polarella glacialis]